MQSSISTWKNLWVLSNSNRIVFYFNEVSLHVRKKKFSAQKLSTFLKFNLKAHRCVKIKCLMKDVSDDYKKFMNVFNGEKLCRVSWWCICIVSHYFHHLLFFHHKNLWNIHNCWIFNVSTYHDMWYVEQKQKTASTEMWVTSSQKYSPLRFPTKKSFAQSKR